MSAAARTSLVATLPAITAALLPKCPMCLAAIAGSIGLELPLNAPSLLPLLILFLAISLGIILRAARRNSRPIGAAVACVAAPLLIAQRAFALSTTVGHVAVLMIVVAAVLTARPAAGMDHCG